MTSSTDAETAGLTGVVAVVGVFVGLLVVGYGALLVPTSALGAAWIAAIGLSLLLSGLVAVDAVGDRAGLSASARRAVSLGFVALAAFLFVAFVAVNF